MKPLNFYHHCKTSKSPVKPAYNYQKTIKPLLRSYNLLKPCHIQPFKFLPPFRNIQITIKIWSQLSKDLHNFANINNHMKPQNIYYHFKTSKSPSRPANNYLKTYTTLLRSDNPLKPCHIQLLNFYHHSKTSKSPIKPAHNYPKTYTTLLRSTTT